MNVENPGAAHDEYEASAGRKISRRSLVGLVGAAGVGGVAGLVGGRSISPAADATPEALTARLARSESVASTHSALPAGVAAPIPACGHILSIDLSDDPAQTPSDLAVAARELLIEWSRLAQQLAPGAAPGTTAAAGADLRAASLEFTIGIGSSLLRRCGLGARIPRPLVPLPAFDVDRLAPDQCDGDFLIQLGAEDPMRLAGAVQAVLSTLKNRAQVRWSVRGFSQSAASASDAHQTARNIMGQRDGTNNPERASSLWETVVTAREGVGPTRWMDGGSYAVVRQIHIDLDGWFALSLPERDTAIGRSTVTGAALGHSREHDPVELARRDAAGELLIDPRAHIRLSSAQNVAGQRIYRRSWNFDHGPQAEGRRAGMLFVAWQADPRRGFIPIQQALDDGGDLLSAHVKHVGSAVYAVPPLRSGDPYVGHELFGT